MRLLSIIALGMFALMAIAAPGPKSKEKPKDEDKLQGTWQVESVTFEGRPTGDSSDMVFAGSTLTMSNDGNKVSFTIDSSVEPKTMDLKPENYSGPKVVVGSAIYELDGDTLRICFGSPRPTELTDKNQPLYTLKRKKK